jgi:hypothetical protein
MLVPVDDVDRVGIVSWPSGSASQALVVSGPGDGFDGDPARETAVQRE